MTARIENKKPSLSEMEAHRPRKLFSHPIHAKEERMAHPLPTKAFLRPSPEATTFIFETHPHLPVLP